MRIAMVGPLAESVPPAMYGGTERVVSWLTEELVRRGHAVTLFASGDSRTKARLVACSRRSLRLSGVRDHWPLELEMIGQVLRRASEFDVIHFHVGFLAFPFASLVEPPVLHTLHGRLDLDWFPSLLGRHPNLNLVSISDAQRAPVPDASFVSTVYHGFPRDLFRFDPAGGDYALFLGRVSPEKGPLLAIDAARRAGVRLVIAAKVDPCDQEFFDRDVKPRLAEPGIEFVGEVDDAAKETWLRGARALLLPIDWPEPFGLVFIEALACGTPVITRPCGSVPEIVRDGDNGLLGSDETELADALQRVGSIDRARCRADFEERFTVEHMTEKYEELYERLAARPRAAARGAAT